MDNNEAAFSLAIVSFAARGGELHLVVGTAADTFLSPRSCRSGYLRTYKFTENGTGLEFLHKVSLFSSSQVACANFWAKTETDDVPLAVMGFQGRLVAGVGKSLRIYDIGKKKLLRKVENKVRILSLGMDPSLLLSLGFRISYRDFEHARVENYCR
jgi:splicing factor 3B subunit 3